MHFLEKKAVQAPALYRTSAVQMHLTSQNDALKRIRVAEVCIEDLISPSHSECSMLLQTMVLRTT
jgi:hypothetical protein